MIQRRRKRWLVAACFATLLSPAQAAKVEFFDDINEGPVPLGMEEHRYLAFGEVMFDYYRHANFNAINKLLVNQELSLFNEDTDYAELLLGDPVSYTHLTLPTNREV